MKQNIAPVKTQHNSINMFRPPYNKTIDSFKVRKPFTDSQKNIDLLFDTFLESYNNYRAGEISLAMEERFKDFGLPGPSQYKAFYELFNFFENEEFELLNQENFYFYDLTQNNTQSERGIVELVENLTDFDFANQDKKIILSCGSFWGRNPETREKMLKLFESIYTNNGVKIHIYTNCEKNEIKGHDNFLEQIKETAHFGLKKRIPIHFIQAGNDYFYIEFPHTEEIIVRLDLFLDLKKIVYKKGFNKANVEQFFNNLIQQALE